MPNTLVKLAQLSVSDNVTWSGSQTFGGTINCTNVLLFNHMASSGAVPSIAAGAGAGTLPTLSITGTDHNGVITLVAGSAPGISGVVATITFANAWSPAPKTVILSPANSSAAVLSGLTMVFAGSLSTTNWIITAGATALTGTITYQWYYQVLG